MNSVQKRGWIGDLTGGLTGALTALPVELVLGLFAVAPLGAAYANHGLRAALWGCILGGILGVILRRNGAIINGTRSASALILGTLAADLLQQPAVQASADPAALVFVLLLLCSALSGVFQIIFGWLQVGRVLKFAPYPVLAGLICGVSLLMVFSALRPMLGVALGTRWSEVAAGYHAASLAVAALSLALCFVVPRWSRRIPGAVVALVVGTLVHHGLVAAFGADQLGATSGRVDGLLPDYSVWQAAFAGGAGGWPGWMPTLAPYALAIAIFSAQETLLCLSTIESITHQRADGDRELRLQGLSNLVSAVLGATPSVSIVSRAMTNLAAGGHSVFSGLAYSAALALIVVFAGNLIGLVPGAVTAGILVYLAITMVDDGVRRLCVQVLTQRAQLPPAQYRVLLANICVIVLVALVAVFGDIMKAVGVGVAAAMLLFVRSSMKPVIRRVFSAQYHRSLKVRSLDDMRVLEAEGGQIGVIEVEGPLFFGTADRVAREIESVAQYANSIILDFSRVRDVDPTGARTLLQVARKMKAQQRELSLAAINREVERLLQAMGLTLEIPDERWHRDLDTALETLEDGLLSKMGSCGERVVVHFSQTVLADGLSAWQTGVLEGYLSKRQFDSPGIVFRDGDAGSSLFVATGSVVDILLTLDGGQKKRVASFAPGVVFGEMALLQGKPRSADAVVQGASTVWELSRQSMTEIEFKHPEIARCILHNLSLSLAERLRLTTVQLRLAAEG